jgi:hypothetical protein
MLENRLRRLEEAIASRHGDELPLPVPLEWTERGPDGRMAGPPPDADPRAVATFRELKAMDRTIPLVGTVND